MARPHAPRTEKVADDRIMSASQDGDIQSLLEGLAAEPYITKSQSRHTGVHLQQ
ncbi:hypothetical protein ACP70R_026079 [Stipagrostis hirtigluma subsp. patula]